MWAKEQAWEWYDAQPWIRGFNGSPNIKKYCKLANRRFERETKA